ncbi:MAG TPA: hypothetical protein PKE45_00545 [Caldilineaceae bacterium]|nr:hypothetical protein [Caldilineaceae bacterium]
MLIIEIKDVTLEKELDSLLSQQFDGNGEEMLRRLLEAYIVQQRRLQYSGILRWPSDALAYQRDERNDWH